MANFFPSFEWIKGMCAYSGIFHFILSNIWICLKAFILGVTVASGFAIANQPSTPIFKACVDNKSKALLVTPTQARRVPDRVDVLPWRRTRASKDPRSPFANPEYSPYHPFMFDLIRAKLALKNILSNPIWFTFIISKYLHATLLLPYDINIEYFQSNRSTKSKE